MTSTDHAGRTGPKVRAGFFTIDDIPSSSMFHRARSTAGSRNANWLSIASGDLFEYPKQISRRFSLPIATRISAPFVSLIVTSCQ